MTYINTFTIILDGEQYNIPFREDGYIFATALCKAAGKRVNNWLRSGETRKIVRYVSENTNTPVDALIDSRKGGTTKIPQGTWVHRKLALHLAMWCSSHFFFQVSNWVEEWTLINNNHDKFMKEIYNLIPDDNEVSNKEKQIQLKLLDYLGGKIEVETDVGFIDLLTADEVIEIKSGLNWKHAVGQVLMYSINFPTHKKRIHLFDVNTVDIDMIVQKCKIYDINVTVEN